MNQGTAISAIESLLPHPEGGLPEEVFLFVSRITPLVNVDLLIQDDAGRTLLTWRDDEYFGQGWHIPGGVIRYKETFAARIRACALQELGAEVSFEPFPLLVLETIRDHRSRGHFISLLYRCRLLTPLDEFLQPEASYPPRAGAWRWHQVSPPDLLDVQAPYKRFFRC
jgi:ADP-ribose pyrophosphatase YjhB (NUDIX family)